MLGKDPIENGRVRGEEFSFTVAGTAYQGRVDGLRMHARTMADGKPVEWTAQALPRGQ
jgi:hypothetical protein